MVTRKKFIELHQDLAEDILDIATDLHNTYSVSKDLKALAMLLRLLKQYNIKSDKVDYSDSVLDD